MKCRHSEIYSGGVFKKGERITIERERAERERNKRMLTTTFSLT